LLPPQSNECKLPPLVDTEVNIDSRYEVFDFQNQCGICNG
jgi:hypothetical protein